MKKYAEAKRRAYRSFSERMESKGYQRISPWIPKAIIDILKEKAEKENISLQDIVVESLRETANKIKS